MRPFTLSLDKRGIADRHTNACNCVGPQNGEPVCPCRMRNVEVRDGRYIEVRDLGPAKHAKKEPKE